MSGTLFVVATPIGNLEDITLRALRVLREADLIAAEDTRRTAKLLAHYAISTPTISFHEHNSRQRVPELVERLEAGAKVALVSDAGTPGIADPGIALVQACWHRSIPVDPVPGASAPLAAAVASGFPLDPLTIMGFAPSRSNDRINWFRVIGELKSTVVFFEAPHRIDRTLEDLDVYFGSRPICVARELTKVHQELLVGSARSIIGRMTNRKGEFTVFVGPDAALQRPIDPPSDRQLYDEFCDLTNNTPSRRNAVAQLATRYGLTTKSVYATIERIRGLSVPE
jgi:16S rRNA (cytidine1402-2'-O)-methyltransferase